MPLPAPAKLTWKDDDGEGFIQVDVIPELNNSLQSTITDFPLEDGSIVSEHIIHHPERLQLQIAQTQSPFEDTDEDGEPLEFKKTSIPLDLPQTRFQPKGLLLLLISAEGALGAVTGAIGGALGLGGGKTKGPAIEVFKPPYEGKDRINDLYDKLVGARWRRSEMTLEWLGRRWSSFYIEAINYSRKKGPEKGEFTVDLKHVQTVSTATAELPDPAEARLKAGLNGGNRPGSLAAATEAEAAGDSAGQSLLSSLKDSLF